MRKSHNTPDALNITPEKAQSIACCLETTPTLIKRLRHIRL